MFISVLEATIVQFQALNYFEKHFINEEVWVANLWNADA